MFLSIKSNKGFADAHTLILSALIIGSVIGVGTYVLAKSGASPLATGVTAVTTPIAVTAPTPAISCGTLRSSGKVYYSVVGTSAHFKAAKNSDSVRNIAYGLCKRALISASLARSINTSGNYSTQLQTAYSQWQKALGYRGVDADGVPGKVSLSKLGSGVTPVGF